MAKVINTGGALSLLLDELERARAKHPGNADLFEALGEEVGELARAFRGDGDVTTEAIHVSNVALRIAAEGTTAPNQAVLSKAVELEAESRLALGCQEGGAA